jgi:hypothetical protein
VIERLKREAKERREEGERALREVEESHKWGEQKRHHDDDEDFSFF